MTGLVAGMAVSYAGCCHPLPGERIVGIVTTGKGVTIHTRDCPTLASFAATPERFIDVDWDPGAIAREKGGPTHTARISVIAENGPGALASLTNAIAKHEGVVVEPARGQPPAGFLRGAGGRGGARPRPSRDGDRRAARRPGITHVDRARA